MNTQKPRNSKNSDVPAIGKFCGLVLWMALLITLSGCSSSKLKVAEYEFIYNGQAYTLRSSYSRGNPKSYNRLIGADFVADDMNQDGIMDKVIKGKVALSEAQKIYDYSLGMLEREGKLNEINKKSKEFTLNKSNYKFSIKSFLPQSGQFNQFIIIDKSPSLYSHSTSMFIDSGADGKLDEVLEGGVLLKNAQQMYDETISEGLKRSELVKKDGVILVK